MPRFLTSERQEKIKGLSFNFTGFSLALGLGLPLRTHRDGALYSIHSRRCSFHLLPTVLEHGDGAQNPTSMAFLDTFCSNPTFESLALQLRECVYARDLLRGELLHHHITQIGLDQNTLFQNLAVQMYGSCGAMLDALHLFAETCRPNMHSWNAVIRACGLYGLFQDAFQFFDQMQQEGVMPDTHIYVSLLSACTDQGLLYQGKYMHARIILGSANAVVGSVLVNMYSKWGSFESARQAFDDMPESDVVAWTTMISVCVKHHRFKDALKFFNQMQLQSIIPNKITLVSSLDACAKMAALDAGKKLHARIVCSGVEIDNIVGNAIVAIYSSCGSVIDAQRIFDEVRDQDIISWTSLISSCAHDMQGKSAPSLLHQMQCKGVLADEGVYVAVFTALGNTVAPEEGKKLHACIMGSTFLSSVLVVNSLITMYGKCCHMRDANMAFNSLISPSVVSWTAMISAYVWCGEGKKVSHAYEQMQQEGVMPNKFTFVGVLHACACEALFSMGKRVHALVVSSETSLDVVLRTALVSMYGKSGSIKDAESTFEHVMERDAILWNAMITTYAHNGQVRDAMRVFNQMRRDRVMPSKVTFMAMLSAFSHSGLIDDSYCAFAHADVGYSIVPERDHYSRVIRLLSRAGLLNEAEGVVENIPFWPTSIETWTTLVNTCRSHNHVDQGDYSTTEKLVKLDAEVNI